MPMFVHITIFSCCSREEVSAIYKTPLLDLIYKAATVHRMYNDPQMVRGRLTLDPVKYSASAVHVDTAARAVTLDDTCC